MPVAEFGDGEKAMVGDVTKMGAMITRSSTVTAKAR
jgi:hypothetical protein